MSVLCVAGGGVVARLAMSTFILGWSHTIEHTRWEEVWRVLPGQLRLETARVQGSGAGMDPAPDARRIGKFWEWHPGQAFPDVTLRRSAQADDWQICDRERTCRKLGALLAADADTVRLFSCE